jgi:Fur family ferric uptake transcriptional regulator
MTLSPQTEPLAVPSLAAALGTMRARGLRVSAARRLVLEALFHADGPVAAEDIASGLQGRLPASDLASVYRNLETLETLGLVRHMHLGHRPGVYSLADRHAHGVAACERCGRHAALAAASLADVGGAIRAACGFEARFTHFPIVGICPSCLDTDDDRPRA